jgi:hypothetical protein
VCGICIISNKFITGKYILYWIGVQLVHNDQIDNLDIYVLINIIKDIGYVFQRDYLYGEIHLNNFVDNLTTKKYTNTNTLLRMPIFDKGQESTLPKYRFSIYTHEYMFDYQYLQTLIKNQNVITFYDIIKLYHFTTKIKLLLTYTKAIKTDINLKAKLL